MESKKLVLQKKKKKKISNVGTGFKVLKHQVK